MSGSARIVEGLRPWPWLGSVTRHASNFSCESSRAPTTACRQQGASRQSANTKTVAVVSRRRTPRARRRCLRADMTKAKGEPSPARPRARARQMCRSPGIRPRHAVMASDDFLTSMFAGISRFVHLTQYADDGGFFGRLHDTTTPAADRPVLKGINDGLLDFDLRSRPWPNDNLP